MINVDHEELQKFSQGDWWDVHDGAYALLHQLNPLRLAFVQNYLSLPDKKVVDLGCGGGIFSEALAKSAAKVTGIDLNPQALHQAEAHAKQQQLEIQYKNISVEDFSALHPQQFDLVTCLEMLEHVPDPTSIIQASAYLLKPQGLAIFSTINRTPRAYVEAVIAAEYVLKRLPRGTHDYQKFIKPSELSAAARQHQLELIALKGITYNPLKNSFALDDVPKVNYLAVFRHKSS